MKQAPAPQTPRNVRPLHGSRTRAARHRQGFTRTELLVILAIVGLLGLLHWPAEANTRTSSQLVSCLGNLRRLGLAWQMFADDNTGQLPLNGDNVNPPPWVGGFMDFATGNRNNYDTTLLLDPQKSSLGPYTREAGIYRCPADASLVRVNQSWLPRMRSYSMNAALGTANAFWLPSPPYRSYQRTSDLISPPPGKLWVFIEEHPDSINDGQFAVTMASAAAQTRFVDYPAAWHDGAASFTFADGHAELHRWVDPRTKPAPKYNGTLPLNVSSPNNPDVLWLTERTSSKSL